MAKPKTKTHLGLLAVLASGDNVTASDDDGRTWAGTIDVVAPDLGIMWVHTNEGERKVFDIHDYRIQNLKDS